MMQYTLTYGRVLILRRVIEMPDDGEDHYGAAMSTALELESNGELSLDIDNEGRIIIPADVELRDIEDYDVLWEVEES